MVGPQNEFLVDRLPTVPEESGVKGPVKHYSSDTFNGEKFDGKTV